MATTVDTLLVRIEADMADLKRDLAKVSQTTERHTDRMADAFRKVGRAIAVIGGTAIFGSFIKSAIDTGAEIEGLRVKLDALLGSAEQGAKAFDIMAEFAGRVPFSLDQIQKGAGSLAAASDNADELGELLQITGNIAAQFGIPFEMASENVQRALSAGIGSADLFKQAGVSAFAGFEAGVSYSASETAAILIKHFGTGGTSDGAMDAFAKTTAGTVSMFGDAMHKFRGAIAESGLNEGFRELVAQLTDVTNSSMGLADIIGNFLGAAFSNLAKTIDFVRQSFAILANPMRSVIELGKEIYTQLSEAFGPYIAIIIEYVQKAIDVVRENMTLLIVATGAYISLNVAKSFWTSAQEAFKFARATLASGKAFAFMNRVIKRSPIFLIAGALGYAAQQFGMFEDIADKLEMTFDDILPDNIKQMLSAISEDFTEAASDIDEARRLIFGDAAGQAFEPETFAPAGEAARAIENIQAALAAAGGGKGKKGLTDLQKAINSNISPIHAVRKEFNLLNAAMETMGDKAGPKLKEAFTNVKDELARLQLEMLEKTYPALTSIRDGFNAMADSLTDALVDAVEKGKLNLESLRDTFRDILRQMIADAIKAQIIRPMISGMFSAVGGAIGGDAGTFISSIGQTKSATGGPVMRGAPVLVGERGPELFVPQGAGSIVNAATTRGMGGGVTVNQTFAFSANGDESVKKIIHQAAPQIAKMTEQGIMGSRRRGGQMKAVFG